MLRKLLPVAIVSLLLVAACGKDDDALRVRAGSPVVALQQAPDAAAQAGSGHIEMTMRLTLPGTTDPVEITGSGDYDAKAHVAAMALDYGAFLEQVAGQAPGFDASSAGLDQPMRIVVDESTMYLDLPFLAPITGTEGWLSVPLADAGGFGAMTTGADPNALLDYLRGAGKVTKEGDEDIDGVATTRYTATIDPAKALEKVPAEQRARVQDQIDQLGDAVGSIPVTVWIDADGLPRRMELSTDAPKLGAVGVTIDWSKFGEPVTVDVPSADEVTPAKDVLGGLAGSFLGQR